MSKKDILNLTKAIYTCRENIFKRNFLSGQDYDR